MSELREMYSIGYFKCNNISSNNNFKYGVLATGNSIQLSENSWKIIEKYNVKAVDMEAAAIAEVAHEMNIDFSATKVITDLVSKEIKTDHIVNQFKTNFHKAMEHLSKHVVTLLSDL
jgi:5'-methylthioadenosine nucleosidase